MPGRYKDAKEWLEDAMQNETVTPQDLAVFILQYVDNDDIEFYFGVNMDNPEDNPGIDEKHCSNCRRDVYEDDYNDSRDMCNECVAETDEQERQEEEDDERDGMNDELATIPIIEAYPSMRMFWIRRSDIDYDWEAEYDMSIHCTHCGCQAIHRDRSLTTLWYICDVCEHVTRGIRVH